MQGKACSMGQQNNRFTKWNYEMMQFVNIVGHNLFRSVVHFDNWKPGPGSGNGQAVKIQILKEHASRVHLKQCRYDDTLHMDVGVVWPWHMLFLQGKLAYA